MITPVSNTNLIVKNTPNNQNNITKQAPVVFMADLEVIGDYTPVARKIQPLNHDVFESSSNSQYEDKAQISFMRRVAKFFGLN